MPGHCFPGYTQEEKIEIAHRHLIPKQLEHHGLTPLQIQIPQPTTLDIITRSVSAPRLLSREAAPGLRPSLSAEAQPAFPWLWVCTGPSGRTSQTASRASSQPRTLVEPEFHLFHNS